MQSIHPKVSKQNCNSKFIIIMDQTPIFFACHSKKTLEWERKKSVNICPSMEDTKRSTLAVSVHAGGTKLPPIVIIKGTQNGQIAKKVPKFSTQL